ncbi:hypothetical protein AX768_02035 [Burkholderia sp. PAMC 28687]|uniref:BREX-1 system adenine-specific DNA-methyltransferase PglX n=1 Tax=Burkholderia sp. PAMC 28687 TaxID=1795874 RepID=UPI0007838BAE|nr:BREX-1 system adenine-specific DNA-methyltransferase PglX [Burkholderia sp. PAMC 28687]AMM13070.1 hypothetical protein AX768_02035 [Burkholderia sp. PAMC 28687]
MNKTNLKAYAPQARLDFIAAVAARANLLGISAAGAAPASVRGDLVIIEGREWPVKVNAQREKLVRRIERRGFEQAMEDVAYTWFNRFAALRFMELHGYLDHGWRVLSSRDGGLPEILRHASDVSLPGLNTQTAREMHLAGTQDNELYKLLLVAQCNDLSRSMPFLFEHIDDETELLLPENLLRTDSIVVKLVVSVPEEDWNQIEAVGWLYQFYISDKKSQIMGKVVRSEDIPAATQLFTPNWIVKYLVQNSIGRLWALGNPTSSLHSNYDYYLEPAPQDDDVASRLNAQMRQRVDENAGRVDPEALTLLDPACGSGHILVEAYDVFKTFYLERGYRPRDIPRLVLEKNIFGIDIDDRAAQLASFSLLMKARADDPRILRDPPRLNIISLLQSDAIDVDNEAGPLESFGISKQVISALLKIFQGASTTGSLIKVPSSLSIELPRLREALLRAISEGDLYAVASARTIFPFVAQAELLSSTFDAVIANPPYMGSKGMCGPLQRFIKNHYESTKADLFACFIVRALDFTAAQGITALVTLQNWMFNSSYEALRNHLLKTTSIESLVQIGFNSFPMLNSKVALAAAFTIRKTKIGDYVAKYINCNDVAPSLDKEAVFKGRLLRNQYFLRSSSSFSDIAGEPISYWTSEETRNIFKTCRPMGAVSRARQGLSTSDNPRFVRYWHEIGFNCVDFNCTSSDEASKTKSTWVPYNKGGLVRRWYGNNEFVVNWRDNGNDIKSLVPKSVIRNESWYFKRSVTWSDITIDNAFRLQDAGFIFANSAHSAFCENEEQLYELLGLLNSPVVDHFIGALSQSLHFDVGYYNKLPFPKGPVHGALISAVRQLVELSKADWDSRETSWGFRHLELVSMRKTVSSLREASALLSAKNASALDRNRELEKTVAEASFQAYGINDVETMSNHKAKLILEQIDRSTEAVRFISYVIGCLMGRYSLEDDGVVYAESGGKEFDPSRYVSFPADVDGIVPVTDEGWFDDDALNQMPAFIRALGGQDSATVDME